MKIVSFVLFVALSLCAILAGSANASAGGPVVAVGTLEMIVPLAVGAGLLAAARVAGRGRRR